MQVLYVPPGKGLSSIEGFEEIDKGGQCRTYGRSKGLLVYLRVETPKVYSVLKISAIHDARKTANNPAFPGDQGGDSLCSKTEHSINGDGRIVNQIHREIPTLSRLGRAEVHQQISVNLRQAEIPYVSANFLRDQYDDTGHFYIEACLKPDDHSQLREELLATSGALCLSIDLGCFPGFFCEWAFEGYDGGPIKFLEDHRIKDIVVNLDDVPADFLHPVEPYPTLAGSSGPHELLSLWVEVAHPKAEVASGLRKKEVGDE